jgi:Restriction endonuclease
MKSGKPFEQLIKKIQESYQTDKNVEIIANHELENKSGQLREFDIVIKANVNNFPILIVIECKDYNKKVPVKEVEAFACKCSRVSEINKKIFVSRNGFQKDAINAANDFDIMLYELTDLSDEKIKDWVDEFGLKEVSFSFTIKNLSLDFSYKVKGEVLGDLQLYFRIPPYSFGTIDNFITYYFEQINEDLLKKGKQLMLNIELTESNISIIEMGCNKDLTEIQSYIKMNDTEYDILAVKYCVEYKFIETIVKPVITTSYSETNSKEVKAEIMTFSSERLNQSMILIRKPEHENIQQIFIEKLNGQPFTIEDFPSIILPHGVTIKIEE